VLLSKRTVYSEKPVADQSQPLLDIKNLKTYFYTEDGIVKAVDGIDFKVYPGEVLGLVGESGCGKSVTLLSAMRLISKPGKIIEGEIVFDGQDLLKLTEPEMTHVRGNRISMIFQQPQTALNPVFKVGDQIAEVLGIHQDLGKKAGWKRAVELLKMVGIPEPERRAESFPHELSGGMAQRVMIAMALACVPELLIADEPTTALDVTIQAQILDLMRDLRNMVNAAVILITHDLGVVSEMAERVAVMYAGRIVEQAEVKNLFAKPLHPYTQGLMGSIPVLGKIKERLDVIPGSVPNLINLPAGCRFAPRCRARMDHQLHICTEIEPDLIEMTPGHGVRCWLYQDAAGHRAPLAHPGRK
jgi:oligopeptide/dipeptide ABC transporter ATP-binding protein